MARKYNPENILFYRPNEIKPELIGTAGLNIKPYSVSSPRLHMLSSQIGQKPAILHGEPPRVYTGFEREHGKFTFLIKMPVNAIIREVIHKYANYTPDGQNSPITLVIFERMDNGAIDVIEVPHNRCTHQTFGFRYIQTDVMKNIYPEQRIEEGTILAKPITLNEDGDWCYGVNLRMAVLPSEEGIEDGLAISESAAKRFEMYGYGTIDISFGKTKLLLNTHGTEAFFKPWLNIGETIPPSSMIVAGREYDPYLAPANMSRSALRRVNQTDDTKFGIPGAKIVDTRIIKGNMANNNLPPEVDQYVDKYWERTQQFHNSILNRHKHFKKNFRSNEYRMSDAWNTIVKTALFTTNAKNGAKKETYRNASLDDTLLIQQYEYIFVPKNGAKYTCRQAGKAVACRVIPDHLMPLDAYGNRLDAYMDDISTSNRMNTPRLDELLITSCAETCSRMMREAYEVEGDMMKAWALLRRFYQIISPPNMEDMDTVTDSDEIREEIEWILMRREDVPEHFINGIRIATPSDMPVDWVKALDKLNEEFPALVDYLWITNKAGEVVKTKYKTMVGEMYFITLERAAQRFAATASAKRQHHAIPVKPSKLERASSPINDSPTRTDGEDETRGEAAILGGNVVGETYDRNLNPYAHQQDCRSIFGAENPARITNSVPRHEDQIDPTVKHQKVIPINGGRVTEIRDHVLFCGGVAFAEGEDGDSV